MHNKVQERSFMSSSRSDFKTKHFYCFRMSQERQRTNLTREGSVVNKNTLSSTSFQEN